MGLSVSDYLGQVEGQYAYDENGAPIYILDDEGNYIDNRGNPTETPVQMPRRAWKMGYDFGVGGLRLSGAGEAVATVHLNLKRARRIVQDGGNLVMPPHHRALRPGQRRARGNRAQSDLHPRQERRWVGLLRLRRRLPSP